jgi:glyoxylase-like metal-dependent hydrolase (beta-lactamase superfamily II)
MFAAEIPDVPLFVHQADRETVGKSFHVRGTFSRRHSLDDDLDVIPIPGHTRGATAFLWDNGWQRALFTGDSIYLSHGEWIGALLDSSDRDAYLRSLELLRGLEFDVLVPWAAGAGEAPVAPTDPADSRRRIEAIIDRIRSGGTR